MKQAASRATSPTIGITLILMFVILLSACQPAATPAPAPTAEPTPAPAATQPATLEPVPVSAPVGEDLTAQLVGPLWMLLAYGDAGNPTVVEAGVTVTAQFSEDGSLSGFGGCNSFFGPYELKGEEIKIGLLGSTMMACEQGMNQEAIVLAALQSATKVTFTPQGRLEIFYNAEPAYERKLVFTPSAKSLVDTLWLLESFGKPDELATPEPGTHITAQFSAEGTLSGDSGCNRYTTSFTAEDGRMEIAMPASTTRACTAGMEQEAIYQQALIKAESYTIQGTTLEITYDGGQGVLRFTSRHLPLENVLWTLVAMNGETNQVGTVPTTALFVPGAEPGTGTLGGVAMCNNYSGGYKLEEGSLKVEGIATTRMQCPEAVMQAQATYLEVLEAAQNYQILGDSLVITSEKGLLTFSADRAPLEGTFWRLDSMGTVESPTVPSQGGEFIAQFVPQEGGPAGLIIGSTGCNDYNAAYVSSLNELKVNLPNKTNNPGCPNSFWEQEQQFFLGLNAASTYRILGNTLQIPYDEGRQTLNFTAFVPQIPPPPSGGPLTDLNGTTWWLVLIGPKAVLPGTQTIAEFAINSDGQTGTISGNSGCNTYNAPITGVLQIGPASVTKQLCPEPPGVMDQEYEYLAALQAASSFQQAYNQLLINTRNGLLVFYNSPTPLQPVAPPDMPSAGPEEPPVMAPTEEPTPEATEPPSAEPTAEPPLAVITAPTQGSVNQPVKFDASGSTPTGSITGYAWDLGDGGKTTGAIVEHQYAQPGTYTVTLSITDSSGRTVIAVHTITIQ